MRIIAKGDDIMEQALDFMESFLNDEHIRDVYDKINDVKEEAMEEGKRENAIETAKSMLKDNMSIKMISKYTGLSKQEIEALR